MTAQGKWYAALRIPAWVIHDIRRSFSTHLHELGTPPHVVEALLNHVSGHKRGPAGTYNKAAYLDERRRAMQRWDDHLQKLLGAKRPATITQLRK